MNNSKHETFCDYTLTNLLTKLGFNWKDYFVAHDINEHFHWEIPLHIAQKWLREVKNCYVGVEEFVHNLDKNNIYYTYNWVVYLDGDRHSGSDYDNTRYYEVALEAGINKALEIILEKDDM